MMGFFTSPSVGFGPGAIEQIAGLDPHRVALLVSPSVQALDSVRRLEEFLRHLDVEVQVVRVPHGPARVAEVEPLTSSLGLGTDVLVAVGGGSTIDLAKAVRARRLRPEVELGRWSPLIELPEPRRPRLVAVSSTAGSGAEMTGAAQLLTEDGSTLELAHRGLAPDWALVDPAFSRSVPGEIAVAHGAEVIGHAVESLASEWANPFSDAMARDALVTALGALPRLARQSRDPEARASLHFAAGRAGLAGANSSLGLAHAWARALMPEAPNAGYARLVALALPATIDFNYLSARDRYEGVAPLFPSSPGATFAAFAERVSEFLRAQGLATDLETLGAPVAELESHRAAIIERVGRSTSAVGNPRVPSPGELGRLFERLLRGRKAAPP